MPVDTICRPVAPHCDPAAVVHTHAYKECSSTPVRGRVDGWNELVLCLICTYLGGGCAKNQVLWLPGLRLVGSNSCHHLLSLL
eukprot:scaffold51370_cov15-Tisochrysis_lutea.AAC.1